MRRTWTIIGVGDVAASLRFYQSLLGVAETAPAHDYFGQVFDSDGTVLLCLHEWGAHEHPSLSGPDRGRPGNGLLLFFRVDDCDMALARARGLVTRLDEEPHVNPNTGTTEFSLRDPDGYYVTISASSAPGRTGPSRLASISPFFIVKDLQASIAYYRDRLGFRLEFQGPEDDPYYAGVSREGARIMLKAIRPDVLPRPNHTRHEWARWDAYVHTLNPDTLFEEFRGRGVSFVTPLSFIDDGLWGFEIADADGYVLAFFELRDGSARTGE